MEVGQEGGKEGNVWLSTSSGRGHCGTLMGGPHLALGSWFPGPSPFGRGISFTTLEFWIDMDSLLLAVIASI